MVARSLAARAAAVVVLTVLCGFSAVHAAADEDQAEAPADTQTPAVVAANAPDGATVAPGDGPKEGAASHLSIGIGPGARFPFGSSDGRSDDSNSDEVLFEGGGALGRFSCLGEPASLAVEQSNVAVRKLGIWAAHEATGILNSLVDGSEAEQPDVWVTDGQLRTFSEDGKQESTVLVAALDSPLPNGTQIFAGESHIRNTELKVQYDCRQEGKAIVELKLRAESKDSSSASICLRWVKKCATGWSPLSIEQDEHAVFSEGQLQNEWSERMTKEGTNRQAIKFMLMAQGIERIRRPIVTSDQKLVSAEILGPLAWDEKAEVSTDSLELTVMFSCVFDGHATIKVMLEKDTFSGDEPERLEFSFQKVCGTESYQHLDVSVYSEKYKNRTKAYSQGLVAPGFGRPCKGFEQEALPRPGMQEQGQGCNKRSPILVIGEEELRTVLELEIDKLSSYESPKFEPQPDITYDPKVLRVQVLTSPTPTTHKSGKGRNHAASKRQVLSMKYTCFKDEESTIMVTLHILAHKSIHLAWTKRCVEPKAKTGKAFTAPQAMLVTMFIIGVIVVLGLVFFFYCGGSEETEDFGPPTKPQKKAYSKVGFADEGGGSNIEMAKKIGNEEVVYHS